MITLDVVRFTRIQGSIDGESWTDIVTDKEFVHRLIDVAKAAKNLYGARYGSEQEHQLWRALEALETTEKKSE